VIGMATYFEAARAAELLFGVMITHCSNRRSGDGPFSVWAFVRGTNHGKAADALVIASDCPAIIESDPTIDGSIVRYTRNPGN
jgi:hypothetical protein